MDLPEYHRMSGCVLAFAWLWFVAMSLVAHQDRVVKQKKNALFLVFLPWSTPAGEQLLSCGIWHCSKERYGKCWAGPIWILALLRLVWVPSMQPVALLRVHHEDKTNERSSWCQHANKKNGESWSCSKYSYLTWCIAREYKPTVMTFQRS